MKCHDFFSLKNKKKKKKEFKVLFATILLGALRIDYIFQSYNISGNLHWIQANTPVSHIKIKVNPWPAE